VSEQPTCFTYERWWSASPEPVAICLEGYDAADKIAYVIRTQKTFWELDQLEYIAMVGPAGGIYLDVGSNIGNHAVFFGRFCADHVVAVEPHPRLHAILRRNLAVNGLGERSTVAPVGITESGTAGTMSLRDEHQQNIGASHIEPRTGEPRTGEPRRGGPSGPPDATAEEAVVTLRRLDDLLDELKPALPSKPITFLKIDVEGMELGVLRSATALLQEQRPQIFVELITEQAFLEASSLLRPFGYESVARLGSPPSHHFIVPGRHMLRENKWQGGNHYAHSVHLAARELTSATPPGAVLVIADLDEVVFGSLLADRVRTPFLEHQGMYFGPPATDQQAIDELMRQYANGATHFVLLWPAFWLFEAFPRFEQFLRGQRCLVENGRMILFELKPDSTMADRRR
jgi:FkbM family methyltransferase